MIVASRPQTLYEAMFSELVAGLDPPGQSRQTGPWREFLPRMFPEFFRAGFGPHHARFWDWVWDMEPGVRPPPFVAIWPRGGAKSTSAEAAVAAVGARRTRSFGLYVSATQDQAIRHVDAIATMLESPMIRDWDYSLSTRLENQYGHSRGWSRGTLRTASGLNVLAYGLDKGVRGVRMDQYRPDLIILDDIDEESDSPETTQKKIETITRAILPAGADHVAVIAIQNLILPDGVFARLANIAPEPADFLADRIISGPVPAVIDPVYDNTMTDDRKVRIIGGTPTWSGMDLDACQRAILSEGWRSFVIERQHEVRERGDKIHDPAWWANGRSRYDAFDPRWEELTVSRIQLWDTAWEQKSSSAYSACVTLDLIPWQLGYVALVRDVWREKIAFASLLGLGLLDAIVQQAEKWGLNRNWPLGSEVVIEYEASGKAAVQSLAISAPEWLKPKIRRYTPKLSKDHRQVLAAEPARAGRIWLPIPHPELRWLPAFEQELYTIPNSTYRDATDAWAQGVDYWTHFLRDHTV